MSIQQLPEDEKARDKVVIKLAREGRLLDVIYDKEGNSFASIKEDKLTELHPTTGLPILHD